MNRLQEHIAAINKIHKDFARIREIDKCRTCTCFYADMLAAVLATIEDIGDFTNYEDLVAARHDLQNWLKESDDLNLHQ